MNKNLLIAILAGILLIGGSLLVFKIKYEHDFSQKKILALEIRKVLMQIMPDLSQCSAKGMVNLPADGQWHKQITFLSNGQGMLSYLTEGGRLFRINKNHRSLISGHITALDMRHFNASPDMLEVRIKAGREAFLVAYFKIRIKP